jgi:chitin synthase
LLTSPPSYPPPNFPASPGDVPSPYPPYNAGPPSPGVPVNFATPTSPNMHYGQAPRRQPRRYKTSKF